MSLWYAGAGRRWFLNPPIPPFLKGGGGINFFTRRDFLMTKEEKKKKGGVLQAIREFVYGVAAHDSARFAMKTRASMEHLFILITMGDMLGVPFLPPYYSLRLLPY